MTHKYDIRIIKDNTLVEDSINILNKKPDEQKTETQMFHEHEYENDFVHSKKHFILNEQQPSPPPPPLKLKKNRGSVSMAE
jgi:hypothetical protein